MGLFRRITSKVRKIGAKAIHGASVGARKVANSSRRVAPLVGKAGKVISMVGAATGQPEIAAVGSSLTAASDRISRVGNMASRAQSGVEKLRKMDTTKEGIEDLVGVGKQAYGEFG